MESGTQVQITDSSEIVVSAPVLTPKQTSTQQVHIPRVVIVATSSQLNGPNVATVDRKPANAVGVGVGGQRMQNPLPSAPIILQPPTTITLKSVQQHSSTTSMSNAIHLQQPTEPQMIHPQAMVPVDAGVEPTSSHARQQVMVIQSSNANHEQIGGNCQTITVSAVDPEGRQEAQTIYPMQFAHTGEFGSEMLYTTTGGSHHGSHHLQSGATYAVYGEGGPYSPQVNYYQNSSIAYQQSLHSPGSTYAIHAQHNANSVGVHEDDSAAQQLSHTTRASPATIQWLLQNYETAEGVSLPRCTLYGHYLKHCGEHKLDPVNAASFGKLIRSVFLGLRTRRLGTRGNSKYHYYGIRIKLDSPLNKLSDDNMTMAMRQQPSNPSRRMRTVMPTTASHSPVSVSSSSQRSVQQLQSVTSDGGNMTETMSPNDQHKHLLGVGMVPNIMLPPMTSLEPNLTRIGLSVVQAEKFFSGYRQHCEDILDSVKNLQFNDVECCWRQFWQAEENSPVDDVDDESMDSNLTGLTRTQLYTMCTLQPVLEYIQTMDFHFYQVIADVLIPNVLKPIPSSLTQSIRNFAKRLENCLAVALQGAPEVVVKIKLDAVGSLAQTVRRYTSLNHLAQAARAVLQNPAQISQMLTDLNRVDFRNVQEQASWVCYCNSSQVEEIEKNFKLTLENQKNLEEWAVWLESVVDQVLSSVCARPYPELIHFSRQFLLKWSFYSSMVMRDLTLRSAPSFGSFHLIRLLFDEYMFYLIEQRVARATGQTTVAIMSQSYRHHIEIEEMDSFHSSDYSDPTLSNHHVHHNEGQIDFSDQFQMVANNNVSTSEGLLNSESINGQPQVVLERPPSSVEVEGYLNDPASEFFISTNHSTQQDSIGGTGSSVTIGVGSSTVNDFNTQVPTPQDSHAHNSPQMMPNQISAVNNNTTNAIDQSTIKSLIETDDDDDDDGTMINAAGGRIVVTHAAKAVIDEDEPDTKKLRSS